MSETSTIVTKLVFPDQLNHHGTLFGGETIATMASAASSCAARRARNPVVLAHAGALDFVAPVAAGSIAEAEAVVERVGRTSITVVATLHGEHLLSGLRLLACRGRFVFVSVDRQGRPRRVRGRPAEPEAREAEASSTELIRPGQTNHHGSVFGGELLRLLDAVAFIAATRHVRLPLVTAGCEQIDIEGPVGIGELVRLEASVSETRLTSLVVEAVAEAEPIEGVRRPCTTARFVMVPPRQGDADKPI
jgi:acyl-CoA hydrolase